MPSRRCIVAVSAVFVLSACSVPAESSAPPATVAARAEAMTMTLYRSPDCSCCHVWADIAHQRGWTVASADRRDMAAFKAESGVPLEYSSCHTAIVGDYFVEGHVPLEAVERLLAEKPNIDGIALPGMPAGSPGMGGVQEAPFEVVAITDGAATPFDSY